MGVRLEGPLDRPRRRYLIEDMQAHLVTLGLLSLARTHELPTITIRKGAKAEPGTGMDRLLRDVFGNPEEAGADDKAGADDADDKADGDEDEDADEDADPAPLPPVDLPGEPADAEDPPQEEETAGVAGADETEPPAGGEGTDGAPDAATDAVDAEGVEEPGGMEPSEEATDTEATDGEGERAVPPPADVLAPQPPPAPERERGADFRNFVDDLLRSLDEE